MSDEIKKMEDEVVKAEPSAELPDPALDEVVGGAAASFPPMRHKPIDITLKRG
jgi:hypothetical protein